MREYIGLAINVFLDPRLIQNACVVRWQIFTRPERYHETQSKLLSYIVIHDFLAHI